MRIGGAGIWYREVLPPPGLPASLADYGLPQLQREREVAVADGRQAPIVFMAAQSTFKLHPSFDAAVRAILEQVPGSHVIFVEGLWQSQPVTAQS